MYDTYIMRRTQIYLTEEQGRILRSRSRETGRTVSDLIREAIDKVLDSSRDPSTAEKILVARRTAGAWKSLPETGAEYVERIRASKRLSWATRQ